MIICPLTQSTTSYTVLISVTQLSSWFSGISLRCGHVQSQLWTLLISNCASFTWMQLNTTPIQMQTESEMSWTWTCLQQNFCVSTTSNTQFCFFVFFALSSAEHMFFNNVVILWWSMTNTHNIREKIGTLAWNSCTLPIWSFRWNWQNHRNTVSFFYLGC